ncbi:glycoside hydrolase 43 family protein [Novosphingobium sp. KN65.2]|uniref:glycoside hydrolase family 43 protein n=1 Tax=Novosphingobium sp. KN65.2 TaxID=1478134 RepID=UPI0005E662EF|nr:glycoside hydrolase 43 family protein [Novosphingobium sp. KN65.2]CDO36541.1 putative glycosyl hydrolase/xylanase [Novosphingobium sp. KN65.2]
MRLTLLATAAALGACTFAQAPAAAQVWQADQGDGTFRNPVLYADYPDPDIIRVGEDFYFATTTFVNTPGITILHSKDLVNWEFYSHVVQRIDGSAAYDLEGGNGYRRGLYATSLRHYRGMFYLAVTPVGLHTRIYYAPDPRGPWQYHELDREAFDPGLFIDDDGTGYIATAVNSDGTITLLTLDRDFDRVAASRKVHFVPGGEGSKIVKRNGWYYIFNAVPPRMALTVSRSRSLFGPWETREQLDDRAGGHQGALVDLPDGRWFGFVMVDAGSIGRMTNLSSVFWEDDWPIWGTPEAPGRVPERARKPIDGVPPSQLASSDGFTQASLGMQWQWNHNPDDSAWSLNERPGWLRLHAKRADNLWSARNTLVQKAQGPRSRAVVKLDIAGLRAGDRCGFGTFGQYSATIAASRDPKGHPFLRMSVLESTVSGPREDVRIAEVTISGSDLWLAANADFTTDKGSLSYSVDGKDWVPLGGTFPLAFAWQTGTFQGEQFALSCFNTQSEGGFLDIDSFILQPGDPE